MQPKMIDKKKWAVNKGRSSSKRVISPQEKKRREVKLELKTQAAEKKRKELLQAKEEKEARIQAYKKKRMEKYKILNKKTKRGQPLMKDRMQLLLKQIQELKNSS